MGCSSKNTYVMLAVVMVFITIGQATAGRRLQQAGGLPSFPFPSFPTPSVGAGFPSFPMPTTPGFPPSAGAAGFPGLPSFPFPNAPTDPNVPAQTTTP